jgi:hypothetical protein
MSIKLTAVQAEHVANVFPECRAEMSLYLAGGAEVVVGRQREVGEAPPYSITVAGTNFWIDCCATEPEAHARARALGLRAQH